MNHIDQKLYGVMLTIELSRKMNPEFIRAKDELQFGKLAMQRIQRFFKDGDICKKTVKYFQTSLHPSMRGFNQRWLDRLSRYTEIASVSKSLSGMNDLERIEFAFAELKSRGLVAKLGVDNEEVFEGAEAEQVAENGFVGLSANQMKKLNPEGNIPQVLAISGYFPAVEVANSVMRLLQTVGFSLYAPDTQIQPKKVSFISLLSHKAFNNVERRKAA